MARRQYANSPTTPTTTLGADISIGAATVTLATDPGSEMPTSGPFSFTVGESPNTKPFNAASRSGTTITLVGTAATAHTAGDPVNTEPVKVDFDKFVQAGEAEIVNADISASAAIAGSKIADVLHTTGAESAAGVKTFTDKIVAKGSALSGAIYTPGLSFDSAYPKAGIYHASGAVILFVENAGTQIAALNLQPTSAQFSVPFSMGAGMIVVGNYLDGSGNPYTIDAFTSAPHISVYTDVSGGQVDITLPDPFVNTGMVYWIADLGNNASVNNIVITCADDFSVGTTVQGAASHTMSTNGEILMLRADFNAYFDNADWRITSRRVP